jgi:hypothetical protein
MDNRRGGSRQAAGLLVRGTVICGALGCSTLPDVTLVGGMPACASG